VSWRLDLYQLRTADYYEREAQCPGDKTPCALCGRPVSEPWPHTVQIVEGGGTLIPEDEPADVTDPGYLGCWPIGSRCWARVAKALKGDT
jgi:hypothetical protein